MWLNTTFLAALELLGGFELPKEANTIAWLLLTYKNQDLRVYI